MKALDPTAALDGDVTIDIWSRKSDYRPAKIAFAATSPDMGTFGRRSTSRSTAGTGMDAPAADQVAP